MYYFSQISDSLFASIVDHLVSVVLSETSALTSVSMEALGHIGLRRPLPNDINHDAVPGNLFSMMYSFENRYDSLFLVHGIFFC